MLIILDRDGVINYDSPDYIKSPDEWHPIADSLTAIAKLTQAGHQVVVATNQSGVGRGYYSLETLQAIHARMRAAVQAAGGEIAAIYYCPHRPDESCACRKPQPGMLTAIANDFAVDLAATYFVGDSMRDVQAAQAAGSRPILVLTGNGQDTLDRHKAELTDVAVFRDLAAVADSVISAR